MKTKELKTRSGIISTILLTIFCIYFYVFEFPKFIKGIKNESKEPTKTDSLTYEIKVRDSIIYDLYQENKRLKLQQQNFQ